MHCLICAAHSCFAYLRYKNKFILLLFHWEVLTEDVYVMFFFTFRELIKVNIAIPLAVMQNINLVNEENSTIGRGI